MKLDRTKFKNKLQKQVKRVLPYSMDIDYAFETVYRNEVKTPKNTVNHVGIEVECYSKVSYDTLNRMIYTEDLEHYINVTDDGSIRCPIGSNSFELRILIPEDQLAEIFDRVAKLFKIAEIKTNESCGLHVHLDMRNRDFKKSYKRLLDFQDVLFGVVNKSRWNNRFCRYTLENGVFNGGTPRYKAINKLAYQRHKTVEIRLHHGTADTKKILKWINLLLLAVNSKVEIPKFKTKGDIMKWKSLTGENKSYVRMNFNREWFDYKPVALARASEPR